MKPNKPTPPASSYWVGATRVELMAAIKDRRPQQKSATVSDVMFDPALSATTALMRDHKWKPGANAAGRN
jgi:hypothetical protein